MNTHNTRRTAACSGALVLALGAGLFVPMSAQASTSSLGGVGSGLTNATATLTGGSGAAGSSAQSTGSPLTQTVDGVLDTTNQLEVTQNGGATDTGLTVTAVGIQANLGSNSTTTTNGVNAPGIASVGAAKTAADSTGTVIDPATGLVSDTAGGLLGGSTGGTGSTSNSGSGGISVTVGQQPDGGSVTSVNLGGAGSAIDSTGGSTSTSTITNTTNTSTTVISGTDTSTAATPAPTPAPAASGSASTSALKKLLGVTAAPSIATVFPAKDGYRDDVLFRIASRTSDNAVQAVTGTAVLRRGTKEIARWTITRSTQDLRWNGLDHGKLVVGDYGLTTEVKGATGAVFSATTKVATSPKRLIASTKKVSALAVSGYHAMAAEPRAGLSKGRVTLRVTTVASAVKGKQFLYFVKNGKRLTVPIKAGTNTSKAIVVPKAFTSFALKHTWKKGQVKLKSIRYTYSYQSLR